MFPSSNPKIIAIEKANLPCSSSPVFPPSSHTLSTKQNNMSSVCQELQSCSEPLSLEPLVLLHQLAPSKQPLSFPWPQKQPDIPRPQSSNTFPDRNGQESTPNTWDFTNNSYNCRQPTDETEQVYVHPLIKLSTSSLSTRSLEMCTESLGSETGNCIDSFSHHLLDKNQISSRNKQTKNRQLPKKVKHSSSSFPPPLTSISGSDGVQVQTHREGGRLVIKAFSFSSCSTYFQTERENGRLRLSLVRDEHELGDNNDNDNDNDNQDEDEEVVEDEAEKDCNESDEEDDYNGRLWGENLKEWSSSRCNGDRISSRKRLPSLPYCVAIS